MPATELVAALKPALEQACKASQHTAECDVPSDRDLDSGDSPAFLYAIMAEFHAARTCSRKVLEYCEYACS